MAKGKVQKTQAAEAEATEAKEKAEVKAEDDTLLDEKVRVKRSQVGKAVRAIQEFVQKLSANNNPLFDTASETVSLLFTLHNASEEYTRNYPVPIPHPLWDEKTDVCFISPDPQKPWKELLLEQNKIPGLTKVMGVGKITRGYKTQKEKETLADAFDLFIAHRRVSTLLWNALGPVFYHVKGKAPLILNLKKDYDGPDDLADELDAVEEIRKVMSSASIKAHKGSPTVAVKIGKCSQPEEELVANAAAVISHGLNIFRNKLKNPLMSIRIQATQAPALPIWIRKRPKGFLSRDDVRKHQEEASSASDRSESGASETEGTGASDTISEANDSLSNTDAISEAGTPLDTISETSELHTSEISEAGSELGDPVDEEVQEAASSKKGKRKKSAGGGGDAKGQAAKTVEEPPAAGKAKMGPPAAKKAKKN